MISRYNNNKNDKIIAYLCKFKLILHDLQVQSFVPSSYKITWKTNNNQTLSNTVFKSKQSSNIVRFNQTLQGQTLMLYNKDEKRYIDKDTHIIVNYYADTKPNQIRELGKVVIKMNKLMEQNGEETLRKGDVNFKSQESLYRLSNAQLSVHSQSSRKLNTNKNIKLNDDAKYVRVQSKQHNARLKFKCVLEKCIQSKIVQRSIQADQFNEDIGFGSMEQNKIGKMQKVKIQSPTSRQGVNQKNKYKSPPSRQQKNIQKSPPSRVQKNIQKQGNTFKSDFTLSGNKFFKSSPSNKNRTTITAQNIERKQNEQKLLAQLEQLQIINARLIRQKIDLQNRVRQLKIDYQQIEQQLKEKESYFETNLQKLEKMDHLRFDYLQLREYTSKLQELLVNKYGFKPQALRLWSSTQSQIGIKGSINRASNYEQQNVRLSSFTIMDEDSLRESKNIRSSRSIPRKSIPSKQRDSILQNDYYLTPSQLNLSNSEMKQIQGSTVRMQKEISFIEIQLHQIKMELQLIKEKYEIECHAHAQTKGEMFNLQQQLSVIQIEHRECVEENDSMEKQIKSINNKLQQTIKQSFKQKQTRDETEYQMTMIIKQQKIQIQILKQISKKTQKELKQIQQKLQEDKQNYSSQLKEWIGLNDQLIQVKNKNKKLLEEVIQCKNKENTINQYLSNLENQISQVYKIVQDKEKSEQQLQNELEQKQQQIDRLKQQILQLQNIIKNAELNLQNTQKQLSLQKIKGNSSLSIFTDQFSSTSPRERDRFSVLQTSNKQLIQRNKQLINLVNKNATNMILFQKQKKQIIQIKQKLLQFKQIKKENQKINKNIQKLNKQIEKRKRLFQQIEEKFNIQKQKHSQDKHHLSSIITDLEATNNAYLKVNIQLKNKILFTEKKLVQNQKRLNDMQIKLSKSIKQKKLLQQTQKILQTKTKNYQSIFKRQQTVIETNQSLIKELQNKLRNHQNYQNSLKNSSNREEGTSQIKLESQIQSSKRTDSHKPITLKKEQSSTVVKNLLVQIQELKQEIQKCKNEQQSTGINQQKSKASGLITLIQEYVQKKTQSDQESQLTSILQRSLQFRLKQQQSEEIMFVIEKAQQISKEMAKYKTQAIRQSNISSKDKVSTIIESLKPVEKAVSDLINITENIQENRRILSVN